MVLEIGDTVIVLVGQLNVVVKVFRYLFLFILFDFVFNKSINGFGVDSQSAQQLSDFFSEVLDSGKDQMIELLFEDLVQWIDEHEVN